MKLRPTAPRALLAGAVALLAACASGEGHEGNVATLTIVNDTGVEISEVYISLTTDTTWGPNQLSSWIPDAGTADITMIDAGVYDLKACTTTGTCADTLSDYPVGIQLTKGETWTWTLTSPTGSIVLNNQSGITVGYWYVRPSYGDGTWSADQLGSSTTVPSGTTFTLTGLPIGYWDLFATDLGGIWSWTHYGAWTDAVTPYSWTLN